MDEKYETLLARFDKLKTKYLSDPNSTNTLPNDSTLTDVKNIKIGETDMKEFIKTYDYTTFYERQQKQRYEDLHNRFTSEVGNQSISMIHQVNDENEQIDFEEDISISVDESIDYEEQLEAI